MIRRRRSRRRSGNLKSPAFGIQLLLVVRSGRTTFGNIEKAFRNLDRSKLIGMVFNDVKPMMFNTQYDYRYYHYKYRGRYPYAPVSHGHRPKTYLGK